MNETYVTLQGWVGTDVVARETPYGTVTSFRIGCTPRFMRNGQWTDDTTSWYTVNACRTVGDNDASSAVLQRLGFAEWGREPAFCAREDGSFDDARHWVLRANPTSA